MALSSSSSSSCDDSMNSLVSAIRAMVSEESSVSSRRAAFELVENFKSQVHPMSVVRTALAIINTFNMDLVLRHVGLKLLEDAIRLRWNELESHEKLLLKNEVLNSLLSSNLLLEETSSLRDGVARLVVEMAKREWPQQWPDFLKELHQATMKGPIQTEVVMLVLLRLVEDVVVLQTLQQSQRRKEIAQALTHNMPEIFTFLLGLLEKYYETKRVCKAILNTFASFVEWIPITTTLANDGYLVRCLCMLLSDSELQLEAAECLLGIVGWKAGKIGDRAHVLVLFKTEMMAPLFQATERAHTQSMSDFNPSHYHFLKKLVQILSELGNQLSTIWIKDKKPAMKCPENFQIYLNALVALADHPSHTLNLFVLEAFNRFLRHPMISIEEVFQQNLRRYTSLIIKKCLKKGLPSHRDDPSCFYAAIDFNNDEEFVSFYGKYRIVALEGIKVIASNISAQVPFQEAQDWLKLVLNNISSNLASLNTNVAFGEQTTAELEAIAAVLDAILSAPLTSLSAILNDAMSLLGACLEIEVANDKISSSMLSVISSLFVVVSLNPDNLLVPTLSRIFAPLNNQQSSNVPSDVTSALKPKFSADTKALRQHCCSLMVKIASRHPKTLLLRFQDFINLVMQLYKNEAVTMHEYATLVESLILVSNEQQSYELQSNLIQAVSEDVVLERVLKNQQVIQAMGDVTALVQFVQLEMFNSSDKASQGASSAEDELLLREQRSRMSFWLHFVLALCRRSQTPTSIEVCRKGNFVLQEFQMNSKQFVALKNPVYPVTQAVLNQLMTLILTLNRLYEPDQKLVNPGLLEPLVAEKNTLLGISKHSAPVVISNATQVNNGNSNVDTNNDVNNANDSSLKSRREREAYYVFNIFENAYNLFTQVCLTGGHEAFANLRAADVQASLLSGLTWLPHIRLRAVVKALKAVINKCPRVYFDSLILPLLGQLTNVMLSRLSDHWMKNCNGVGLIVNENDSDNDDSQEVLDDVVGRQLTREYLDVIKAALTSGGGADIDLSSGNGLSNKQDDNSANIEGSKGSTVTTNLSELGRKVMENQPISDCILTTLLKALRWPDSPSSVRAASLIETLLPHLPSMKGSQIGPEVLMIEVLKALNELGHHEPNYIALLPLAIHAYESLRPFSEGVKHVLAQVPGCASEDLDRFDERIINKCVQEKAKKDMFRKMVQNFIGKDVGKMFQHEVVIKNLPAPIKKVKPNTNVLMEKNNGEDAVVGQLFQVENQSQHL